MRFCIFVRGHTLFVCIFCVYTLDGRGRWHVFVCAYKYFQYVWYATGALVVGDEAIAQELACAWLVSQFANTAVRHTRGQLWLEIIERVIKCQQQK